MTGRTMLPPMEIQVLPVINPIPHRLKKLKLRSRFGGVGRGTADDLRLDLVLAMSRETILVNLEDRWSTVTVPLLW